MGQDVFDELVEQVVVASAGQALETGARRGVALDGLGELVEGWTPDAGAAPGRVDSPPTSMMSLRSDRRSWDRIWGTMMGRSAWMFGPSGARRSIPDSVSSPRADRVLK